MHIEITGPQMWVIIGLSFLVFVSMIALMWSRGGTVSISAKQAGALGLYIPELWRKAHPHVDAALECMFNELPKIRKVRRDRYQDELRDLGLPEHLITAHEDYAFYDQCLGNVLYSGNGIRSMKSILELEIIHGGHRNRRRDSELNHYVHGLALRMQTESDSYLDRSYRSQVTTDTGEQRLRKISRERLRQIEDETLPAIETVLRDMIVAIQETGCKA